LKSADQGNVNGLVHLAGLYSRGDGCEINRENAFDCFLRAANEGDLNSMYSLSFIYRDGNGTDIDLEKAFKWMNRAAEGINLDSWIRLAFMYKDGQGCEQNDKEAMKWTEKFEIETRGMPANADALEYLEVMKPDYNSRATEMGDGDETQSNEKEEILEIHRAPDCNLGKTSPFDDDEVETSRDTEDVMGSETRDTEENKEGIQEEDLNANQAKHISQDHEILPTESECLQDREVSEQNHVEDQDQQSITNYVFPDSIPSETEPLQDLVSLEQKYGQETNNNIQATVSTNFEKKHMFLMIPVTLVLVTLLALKSDEGNGIVIVGIVTGVGLFLWSTVSLFTLYEL
jgi:TPR repeat protein